MRVISGICAASLFANSAYSSIAPFFPGEAMKKGMDTNLTGFIFSGYSLSMCLLAPLTAKLMNRIGRKRVLQLGCFSEVSILKLLFYCSFRVLQ